MTTYLIDTDWIIDCLDGRTAAVETLVELSADGLAVSLMTYGERYQGAYYARAPQNALRGLRTFLRGKRLLPLNRAIVEGSVRHVRLTTSTPSAPTGPAVSVGPQSRVHPTQAAWRSPA